MKDFREQANHPLQKSQMIEQRGKRGEEYRHGQDLKKQDESDRTRFAGTCGKRAEQKGSAGLRGIEQTEHAIVQPQERQPRSGHTKDQQANQKL
jgi:hypothetical protein